MRVGEVPVRAVVLDWAGTTVDYGSLAPVTVYREIFHRAEIEVTVDEARGPMGRSKRDHLARLLFSSRVSRQWEEIHGRPPTEEDVDDLFQQFLPLQKETLARAGADVIPGVSSLIETWRARGIRIGSTTGYTRELMTIVGPIAARQGYSPDCIVCSDEVPEGRPAPWMNYLAAKRLGNIPLAQTIIVDDTEVGIEAALNAGAIAVAVSQTGNALGLSEHQVAQLSSAELQWRLAEISGRFREAGAHYVVPGVADLNSLIDPD